MALGEVILGIFPRLERVNAVLTSHKNVCLRVVFLNLLHLAEVEFGDVRRAEGAQVQIPIMLVDLADVGCNQAVGVVEAARAHATVVELCNQTVPGNKLHQDILAEELQEGGGDRQEGVKGKSGVLCDEPGVTAAHVFQCLMQQRSLQVKVCRQSSQSDYKTLGYDSFMFLDTRTKARRSDTRHHPRVHRRLPHKPVLTLATLVMIVKSVGVKPS